jgi:putative transposase
VLIPIAPNDRWSLDFVPEQLTDCCRFRILTIVDDCTREMLGPAARHLALRPARSAATGSAND